MNVQLASALLLDAPPGFVRQLIESRLVAILLGVGALVIFGLWLAWQLRGIREIEGRSAGGQDQAEAPREASQRLHR